MLNWTPRWFDANAYQTLGDYILQPLVSGTVNVYSPTPTRAETISISDLLTTPASAIPTQGLLQAITEVFTSEMEYLRPALIQLYLITTRTFDTSEVEYVWVVDNDQPIETLEVLLSSDTWHTIERAGGDHDLFWGADWKWLGVKNSALIAGFDLVGTSTEARVDSWQFSYYDPTTSGISTSIQYFLHPQSHTWIPIHPTQFRAEDGFTGYWSETSTQMRARAAQYAGLKRNLQVRINGQRQVTATLAQPWTSLDERGLWLNMARRESESNTTYENRLANLARVQGQTRRKLELTLGCQLGSVSNTVFTTSASSVYVVDNSGRYVVQNYNQYVYVLERMVPDVGTTNYWKSSYASPELGAMFLNGVKLDHSQISASGSLWSVDKTVNNKTDVLYAQWRIKLWEQAGSYLNLTENFPLNVEELMVSTALKVEVEANPSDEASRRSFRRTSPTYRWSSAPADQDYAAGLAQFS